jgi:hypothetical protein
MIHSWKKVCWPAKVNEWLNKWIRKWWIENVFLRNHLYFQEMFEHFREFRLVVCVQTQIYEIIYVFFSEHNVISCWQQEQRETTFMIAMKECMYVLRYWEHPAEKKNHTHPQKPFPFHQRGSVDPQTNGEELTNVEKSHHLQSSQQRFLFFFRLRKNVSHVTTMFDLFSLFFFHFESLFGR